MLVSKNFNTSNTEVGGVDYSHHIRELKYISSLIFDSKERNTKIDEIKSCRNDQSIITTSEYTVKLLDKSKCANMGFMKEINVINSFQRMYIV